MPVKFDVPEVARAITEPVSATPVDSMVEMRLLYPTPDDARLVTEPVKATPVDSIVEMRLLLRSILAPVAADVPPPARPDTIMISDVRKFPVEMRLAEVATPVDSIVEMRLL